MDILSKVFECGIVPVIKLDSPEDGTPLCCALEKGGVSVAEITFRTDAAEQAIRQVSSGMASVLVGAGTVLSVETAQKAVAAGAKFIVTPGINKPVIEYCLAKQIPVIPGCSSPTDIETALSYEIHTVKFFPAEAMGGLKALKAMSAPYSMVRFMPTGGIDAGNIGAYMQFDRVIACGGSWMVPEALIRERNFEEITRITKEAVLQMHGFAFDHIALNPGAGQTAESIADQFTNAFGFDQSNGNNSIFSCGRLIEVMREQGLMQQGHIGIKTNNVKRAMAFLKKNGFGIDAETIKGSVEAPRFVYLKDSFGPFKVHLTV